MTQDTQATAAHPEPLLTIPQAAQRLAVSRWQIYELMKRGELAYVQGTARSGSAGWRRIEPAEIRRYIEAHRVTQ